MPENYSSEQVEDSLTIFEEIDTKNKQRKKKKEKHIKNCEKIKKYCWGRK